MIDWMRRADKITKEDWRNWATGIYSRPALGFEADSGLHWLFNHATEPADIPYLIYAYRFFGEKGRREYESLLGIIEECILYHATEHPELRDILTALKI